MASTNKTTHYNLSQYVGSDKPTYLVDYNTDMSNIDTGIYDAQAKANLNDAKIGDLEDLTTTTKLDIVDAVNEINSQVGDNTSDIGTLTTDVGNNTTAIGNLIDLDTTDKTDLVSAINEVDGEAGNNTANIGLLSSLTTTDKSNLVNAINEVDGDVSTNTNNIGDLTTLNTYNKNNLVDAINELDDINNYSTTEKIVGTFTDGKPVYEKCISGTTTPNGQKEISIDSDLKRGWLVDDYLLSSNDGSCLPLNFTNGTYIIRSLITSSGNLRVTTNNTSLIINGTFFARVRYTKTTD